MQEIWKDIEGYEGLYQVSNLGRVKSLEKNIWNGHSFRTKKEFIFVGGKDKRGYLYVILSKNGVKKIFKLHRLVAFSFIPNLYNKQEVNHINGIKTDNRVENLEWCTHKENIQHACKNGLRCYKKINQYDLQGNLIKSWKSITEASNTLNINYISILNCCKNKTKKSHNYIWKYAD